VNFQNNAEFVCAEACSDVLSVFEKIVSKKNIALFLQMGF
jgi:hypothetical protein